MPDCLGLWIPTSVSVGAFPQGNALMTGFPCTAGKLCTPCCLAAHSPFNNSPGFSTQNALTLLKSFELFKMVRFWGMRLTFMGYLPVYWSVEAEITWFKCAADSWARLLDGPDDFRGPFLPELSPTTLKCFVSFAGTCFGSCMFSLELLWVLLVPAL